MSATLSIEMMLASQLLQSPCLSAYSTPNHPLGKHMHNYVAVTGIENEHYSTVSGLIRLVISLECVIEITPYFLCPFRTPCTVNFRATVYW